MAINVNLLFLGCFGEKKSRFTGYLAICTEWYLIGYTSNNNNDRFICTRGFNNNQNNLQLQKNVRELEKMPAAGEGVNGKVKGKNMPTVG